MFLTAISIFWNISLLLGCPGGARGKQLNCQCQRHRRCGFNPWVGKIPLRKEWQPTAVSLPGESHGQRSLVGYNPQGSQRVRHNWATSLSLSPPKMTLFGNEVILRGASLVAQKVKCLPAMHETWFQSLGQIDPLEKEIATHSSTLA